MKESSSRLQARASQLSAHRSKATAATLILGVRTRVLETGSVLTDSTVSAKSGTLEMTAQSPAPVTITVMDMGSVMVQASATAILATQETLVRWSPTPVTVQTIAMETATVL